jgi:hypothetical protein
MTRIAIFLGGPEDMTKRAIDNPDQSLIFYERISIPAPYSTDDKSDSVPCREIKYRHVATTAKGVLVFEVVS